MVAEVFRQEAEELFDRIAQRVQSLRERAGGEVGDTVDRLLGDLHNLKGAASSVGQVEVERLTHAAESALLPAHEAQERPADSVLDALDAAVAAMGLCVKGAPPTNLSELRLRLAGATAAVVEPTPEPDTPVTTTRDATAADTSGAPVLRVPAARLDRLLGFGTELSIAHARLRSRGEELAALCKELRQITRQRGDDPDLAGLGKRLDRMAQRDRRDLLDFGHLTVGLRDGIRQLRMIPLRSQEPVWRGVVRESAATLQRRAQLRCELGLLELDKVVLDALSSIMLHLLRNAVAHGIESEEERLDAGKPREGRVLVEAHARGAYVELTVSDDGRGLDWDAIARAAARRRLIDPDAAGPPSRPELEALLFSAGFSTVTDAEPGEAAQIRGRGIGLHTVRNQLRALGGSIDVATSSRLGGTTFVCLVPTSVISTLGLLVVAENVRYALPIEHVQRSVRLPVDAIRSATGGDGLVGLEGDEPLRLVTLAALTNPGSTAARTPLGTHGSVVVLEVNRTRLGLLVDEVHGQTEYVTHNLPFNYQGVAAVRGAIIEADGAVALALDVPDLFELAQRPRTPLHTAPPPARRGKRVLVVDDSISFRVLEREQLTAAGYDVTVAADGQEAWQALRGSSFDLVVSDVQMPNMDGLTLTRNIRRTPELADLPVILVSRLASAADRAASADAGADEYLVKGQFDHTSLIELVARYLEAPSRPRRAR